MTQPQIYELTDPDARILFLINFISDVGQWSILKYVKLKFVRWPQYQETNVTRWITLCIANSVKNGELSPK